MSSLIRRGSIAVITAALLLLGSASAANADTNLHAPHVDKNSATAPTQCKGDEGLEDGQVLWHFVLVQTTAVNSGELTANFANAGSVTQVNDKHTGKTLHWNVITSGHDILTGASTTADGKQLNLSHICASDAPPSDPKGSLTVIKWFDQNGNGIKDEADSQIPGWKVAIFNSDGVGFSTTTTYNGSLFADTYAVQEEASLYGTWTHSYSYLNGEKTGNDNPVYADVTVGGSATVEFGNYCTVPGGGKTLGFWSNKNGGQAITSGNLLGGVLALPLVHDNGSKLGSVNLATFQKYLTSAKAKNMANMLSAQLAATWLSVNSGNTNGAYYVPGYGGTVNALIAEATAELAADGNTPSGDPNRAVQEELKNYLDYVNNNGALIPNSPYACEMLFSPEDAELIVRPQYP